MVQCLLLVLVGLDRMAVGMDVDVAGGVENPRYATRTNGSATSAELETGGVVRTADTVRVSRTMLRRCRRTRSRRRSQFWRRRLLVWATTSLFWPAREFWKKNSNGPEETQQPEEHGRSTSRSSRNWTQTRRGREREVGGDAGEYQSSERNSESSLRGDQDIARSPRRPASRGRVDGQEQESRHVPAEHGGNTKSRTTRIELRRGNYFEETGWMDERRVEGGDCQLVGGSGELVK